LVAAAYARRWGHNSLLGKRCASAFPLRAPGAGTVSLRRNFRAEDAGASALAYFSALVLTTNEVALTFD